MSHQEARGHDPSYKRIFSHPYMVRTLLESFVEPAIVAALDLDKMEPQPTTFSFKELTVREPDVIWRIARRAPAQGAVYVMLLLEFQSSVDWMMPVRLMQYMSLAYEHDITQQSKEANAESVLPATLPIVLYNGRYRWKAPTSLRQMMRFEPDEALSKYSPALQFMLIDAGALDPDVLDHMHNACAQLLRLEQLDDPEALLEHAARLVQLIHSALPQSVREDLATWLSELLRSANINAPVRTILHKESSPMIFDTARRFEAHFTQKGLEQGLLRGKRETAAKLLSLKFGPDDTRVAWMEALSAAQLDLLTELLLSADDERALRAQVEACPEAQPEER